MGTKFEDITTFNLDNKTYAITALPEAAKDLLKVYLSTEEDVVNDKIKLVKSQHALASMGNMFREMIKDVKPLPLDEIRARQAAEALAAAKAELSASSVPPAAPKRKPAKRISASTL